MTEACKYCVGAIFVAAAVVFLLLLYLPAPYGKFFRRGWGPAVSARLGWLIMEMPAPGAMTALFCAATWHGAAQFVFLALWLLHYLPRTFIYPFRQSGGSKPFPLAVTAMGFAFNCLNGFANGCALFFVYPRPPAWLSSWQFTAGTIIFFAGYVINLTADERLRRLRRSSPGAYRIPYGWLFEYISCPHYFGEIIEWIGWAILTWTPAGLAFAAFTFANLFPRALSAHRWYRDSFPDYPPRRRAVIPFVV